MNWILIKNYLLSVIFRCCKVINNIAYFDAFHGMYSDNPKPISIELYKRHPEIQQIWVIGKKSNEKELPKYIKSVIPNSILDLWYRSCAGIVIDNYLGLHYGYEPYKSLKSTIIKFLIRPNQLNLSTWHGTPLKNIEREGIEKMSGQEFICSSSGIIVGNQIDSIVMKRKTEGKIKLLKYGNARNDILFNHDPSLKDKLLRKIGLPCDKKICLFAPTFRENKENSGLRQLELMDVKEVCQELGHKFGGEWIFIARLHDSVMLQFESEIRAKNSDILYSGNTCDDMAEYLYVSDVLITDYSGSLFDYMFTKKPCFLFCHDLEHYEKKERGFNIDIHSLPYPLAEDKDKLIRIIKNFNNEILQDKIKDFIEKFEFSDDGHSAERTISFIEQEFINRL